MGLVFLKALLPVVVEFYCKNLVLNCVNILGFAGNCNFCKGIFGSIAGLSI